MACVLDSPVAQACAMHYQPCQSVIICLSCTQYPEKQTRPQAAAAQKQQAAARDMVQRAPAKKLAGALLSRGYQIGRPQLRVGGVSGKRLRVKLVLRSALSGCWLCTLPRQMRGPLKALCAWQGRCAGLELFICLQLALQVAV